MRGVLDEEKLVGPLSCAIRLRPPRTARVIKRGDYQRFLATVELACQVWGGAGHPFLPLDEDLVISTLYRDMLLGAGIDQVEGLSLTESPSNPVDYGDSPIAQWGDEFAAVALHGLPDRDRPVVVAPTLSPDDPWSGIYAACLGRLPEEPNPELMNTGQYVPDFHFEKLIDVKRPVVSGSATDLIDRIQAHTSWTPRQATLAKLASGFVPHSGIRASGARSTALPGDRFAALDAGPNIVVICTPRDIDDLALLWNLRAAHSDRYVAPIGLLLEEFDPTDLSNIIASDRFCRQGIPHKNLYITSTSVSVEQLRSLISDRLPDRGIEVTAPEHLATLGPAPARHRSEVLTWDNGRASFLTIAPQDRTDLEQLLRTNLRHNLLVDLSVTGHEFPAAPDLRVGGMNQDFFAGSSTLRVSSSRPVQDVAWPHRLLMARSVCSHRGVDLSESAPGRVAMTFLESVDGIRGLDYLAHAPILDVLESMAQRLGTAWAKAHLRGGPADSDPVVAPTEDDLPEVTFDRFRIAFKSTLATRNWLAWAEKRKVVIKGFPITCETCDASQWLPITGFTPPVTCRGCGREIERPFPKESLHFKYRLGEAIRRVWEHDAMGHLLLLRYIDRVFEKSLVGTHPGMDVSNRGDATRIGEADCLTLFKNGAVVPAEVKRSFAGVSDGEVAKLDTLVEALRAPWSFVAVSQYYDASAAAGFSTRQVREGPPPHRVLLTFDHLLDLHPVHQMGADHPTAWAPISDKDREEREARFVKMMEHLEEPFDILEWDMIARPPGEDS